MVFCVSEKFETKALRKYHIVFESSVLRLNKRVRSKHRFLQSKPFVLLVIVFLSINIIIIIEMIIFQSFNLFLTLLNVQICDLIISIGVAHRVTY